MRKYPILEIIKRNWFQPREEGKPFVLHFEEDIRSLPDKNLAELISLYLEASGESRRLSKEYHDKIKDLRSGKVIGIGRTDVSISNLAKFLHVLTLIEYGMHSIVLKPPRMRTRELDRLAESVGISVNKLVHLYELWHLELKQKISSRAQENNIDI